MIYIYIFAVGGISVNIDKTSVMVCKNGNRPENIDLFYDNYTLNNVTKFT